MLDAHTEGGGARRAAWKPRSGEAAGCGNTGPLASPSAEQQRGDTGGGQPALGRGCELSEESRAEKLLGPGLCEREMERTLRVCSHSQKADYGRVDPLTDACPCGEGKGQPGISRCPQ